MPLSVLSPFSSQSSTSRSDLRHLEPPRATSRMPTRVFMRFFMIQVTKFVSLARLHDQLDCFGSIGREDDIEMLWVRPEVLQHIQPDGSNTRRRQIAGIEEVACREFG